MKIKNRLLIFLLMCIIGIGTISTPVWAKVPDPAKKGSVSVSIHYKDQPVAGGSLEIIKVADVDSNDGNYFFAFSGDCKDCPLSLKELDVQSSSGSLAADLAAWVKEHKITGETLQIDDQGHASEKDLPIGLYLIMQKEAAKGYESVNPFLIGIPSFDGEKYVYDADASPKVQVEQKPVTPPTPNPPPHKPPHLPQTGQLWWPVPILAISGLILFVWGWSRRRDYE